MMEEQLSEDVRKYYLLRYAVIVIVLLSSGVILGASLGFRGKKGQVGVLEEKSVPALHEERTAVSAPVGGSSLWLIGSVILLIFGVSYTVYTRISIPRFVRGYVEDQIPFWPITRKYHDFVITMDDTALRIHFFPNVRRGRSAFRIDLLLPSSLPGEQVRKICEQNGMRFSAAENLVYMLVTPEELNLKLLIFSRVVRQINALTQANGGAM
ncbi:MAG: hypothetical protein ACE5R6_13190 [Candidatus Heimdallarchaeota archaeon]